MNNNWYRYTTDVPPEGDRLLISDGADIVVARYIKSDTHINWIYDEASP